MELIIDGIVVTFQQILPVGAFFIASMGMGLLCTRWLFPASCKSIGDRIILAPVIGLVPLTMFSYGFIQLARVWTPAFIIGSRLIFVTTLVFVVLFLLDIWKKRHTLKGWGITGICLLCFVLFLALRLAFLKDLALPPYHDSVEHYRILISFLNPENTPGLFSQGYYHFGFHSIAAWLVEVAGVTPETSLALLGQLLLSLVPLTLYAFVHALTHNWKPSLISALIGAFSWSMPAHAANWGKYPAMAAVIILPALLALLILLFQVQSSKWKRIHLFSTGLFVFLGITFLHSRGLICLVLAVICLLIDFFAVRYFKLGINRIIASILAAGFLIFVFLTNSILWLYATPVLPFIVFVLAMVAGVIWNPRFTIGASLWMLLIWALTFLPAPGYFQKYSLYSIDTPFLQIAAFLPFTLLTGIGFSAVLEKFSVMRWIRLAISVGLAAFLLFGVFTQSYQPNDCCNYASNNDRAAINWIGQNLPEDAQIAIPGRLDLYPVIGSDAGIWVTPLTGRQTFMLSYDFAWFEENAHNEVCDMGVVYIYSSTFELSFQLNEITHPEWYQPVNKPGDVVIYRVIGCTQ